MKFKLNKRSTTLLLILFSIVIVLTGVILYLFKTGRIRPSAEIVGPSFVLQPASQIINVGQTFGVNIWLNSAGKNITAATVRHIHYDPTFLEVQDADSSKDGVQIQKGTIFPQYFGNKVDSVNGTIELDAIINPPDPDPIPWTGNDIFASITFKALKIGNATVTIDYTPGNANDSNISELYGGDVLAGVSNGSYTVNSPTSTPTPTPTVTQTSGGGGEKGTPTPTVTPTQTPTSTPTSVSQSPENPPIIGQPSTEPTPSQITTSGEPVVFTSPEEFGSPIPSASPEVQVAGRNQSAKIALIVLGSGALLTIIAYLVWNWYRKKKGLTGPDEDETI